MNKQDPSGEDALTCAADYGLGLFGGGVAVGAGIADVFSAGSLTPLTALGITYGLVTADAGLYGIVHNRDCN